MSTDAFGGTVDAQALRPLLDEVARLQGELGAARAELQHLKFAVLHDLRAPLRHIRAFAQIIEEDHGAQLDAAVSGHLTTIHEAAVKAMQLLDDLSAAKQAVKPPPLPSSRA